jgi:hypothetical protein
MHVGGKLYGFMNFSVKLYGFMNFNVKYMCYVLCSIG